jgi:hypothetical protein
MEPFNELPDNNRQSKHEVLIEVLKFLSPLVALASSLLALTGRYPSLSKPWIFDTLIGVGLFILLWIAKPHLTGWLSKARNNQLDKKFIRSKDSRLRELLGQFAIFVSGSDSRSLIVIVRSGCSQNQQSVERLINSDYMPVWLTFFQEQLKSVPMTLEDASRRYREFGSLVHRFNTDYALHVQRQLQQESHFSGHYLAQLEEFRHEYNAFLRDVEHWSKDIANYLQVRYQLLDQSTLWHLAPNMYFERIKAFEHSKNVGA